VSDICRNCGGTGKEKCWNCDGAGGTWRETAGERIWVPWKIPGEKLLNTLVLQIAELI
jgi:hypothetical protein